VISSEICSISLESVRQERLYLGFEFMRPIHTFLLTLEQNRRSPEFSRTERELPREWDKILFTDEIYVRPRRGETGPDVEVETPKLSKMILIFGGTSLRHKPNIILIEKGTADAETYVDDCWINLVQFPKWIRNMASGNAR
jgi:hypothetical protein